MLAWDLTECAHMLKESGHTVNYLWSDQQVDRKLLKPMLAEACQNRSKSQRPSYRATQNCSEARLQPSSEKAISVPQKIKAAELWPVYVHNHSNCSAYCTARITCSQTPLINIIITS